MRTNVKILTSEMERITNTEHMLNTSYLVDPKSPVTNFKDF